MSTQSKILTLLACTVVALLLTLVAARVFFFDYYRIPQNGMYPTLPAGSLFFTAKRAYSNASEVERGESIKGIAI